MRLIDADDLKEWECEQCEYENKDDTCKECCGTMQRIDEMPTIDAVEVVRCIDCKHHEHSEPGMIWCPIIDGSWIEDNFFCAYGSRREVTE